MSPQTAFALALVLSSILTYIPGICAISSNVFKVFPDSDGHLIYDETLDIVTVMSALDCARLCSSNTRCSGYIYEESNRTCNIREFIRNLLSEKDLNSRLTQRLISDAAQHHAIKWRDAEQHQKFPKILPETSAGFTFVCDEAPDMSDAQKVIEGYYAGAVTTYTCSSDFKPCLNRTSSVCLSTGQWEDLTGLCGRLRWPNPKNDIRHYLPCGTHRMFTLTVWATFDEAQRSSVNIMSKEYILMHAYVKASGGTGVGIFAFNHKTTSWGPETSSTVQVHFGKELQMVITENNGDFELKVDGTWIYTYTTPLKDHPPDAIMFWNLFPRLLEIGP